MALSTIKPLIVQMQLWQNEMNQSVNIESSIKIIGSKNIIQPFR